MRIVSNRNKCEGHARCAAEAPDVFGLDGEGFTTLDGLVDVAMTPQVPSAVPPRTARKVFLRFTREADR